MKNNTTTTLVLLSNILCFSLFVFVLTITSSAEAQSSFKCNSTSNCKALIDYVSPNATTLSKISTLFGIKNLRSILGANSLPVDTKASQRVAAKQTIKIPFPCACINGTGISDRHPVYQVKPDDGLDHIARDIFSALVTFQQIAAVNNISNPDKIDVGQKLWIPLPCSCDRVNDAQVVHYGHVVAAGSSVDKIAQEYGTTEDTLLKLNGIADAKDLLAGAVLDVPLRACRSTINSSSSDYPLLVPNGTYTFTANNCVQCKCDLMRSSLLRCEPSPKNVKVQNWPQCPAAHCEGSEKLPLGNTSSTPSFCGRQVCSYAGYDNNTILTDLVDPQPCGRPEIYPPSSAAGIDSLGSTLWLLLIALNLSVLLSSRFVS